MTADIKPKMSTVKHSYITRSNAFKQSIYGSSIKENYGITKHLPSNITNGNPQRIRSAAAVEQDWQVGKDHPASHVTYTKFRPVTSHPTTSLLASLYKQQSFAESRNSQAASKLPTILQNRPMTHHGKTSRELKPFANPVYSSSGPAPNGQSNNRKYAIQTQKPPSRTIPNSNDLRSEPLSASAAWSAVHESILANGHGMFQDPPSTAPAQSNPRHHAGADIKLSTNKPSINYMPFYEVRGRGDGASVVDIPSIDVEGKKIEKSVANLSQRAVAQTATNVTSKTQSVIAYKNGNDEANPSRKSDEQSSVRVTETTDEVSNPLVSSLMKQHRNNKSEVDTAPTSTKVEKKVRFSGTVTTNKISEEPSYTEALIHSLHKSFKQHNYLNTTHRTVSQTLGSIDLRNVDSKRGENESVGDSSPVTGDDEDQGFVTPIMKVVVTKRETPAGAEQQETKLSSPREPQHIATPQQITVSVSRMLNNPITTTDREVQSRLETRPLTTAEVIRKGTQATQRASTAGYTRNKEAIARVVKLVPKRQTVVMPNFSKQPAWSGRNFPQHYKNKFAINSSTSPAFSASVQGNNFNQPTKEIKFKKPPQSSKENLRSRLLANSGSSPYLSKLENRRARHSRQSMDDKKKAIDEELAATPLIALPTTENVSQVAMLSPRLFTEFQPIPSMPDHINFCDPRKTEIILHWLEDVNKKRNIEARLRRVGLSR